jgi:glycosyltransferase involved in cell wall biosynthesis
MNTSLDPGSSASSLRLFGIEADCFTGAGMIQRALADGLPESIGPAWTLDHQNGDTNLARRLMAGRDRQADASVWISTPMPIAVPSQRHAHFVLDLRWRQTRSKLGATYRGLDLRRILRESQHIFTISDDVQRQIEAFSTKAVSISVVPMGPGQVEGRPRVAATDTKTIVMMGRARHKRNQELASMLARSPVVRSDYQIIAISVADEVRTQLEASDLIVECFDGVDSDQLGVLLDRSSVYIALTTEEGFGLPYVEAAYCGADVIAVDGAVAREALGPHAVYLSAADPNLDRLEAALAAWDAERVGQLTDEARSRSWGNAVDHVAHWVLEHRAPTR